MALFTGNAAAAACLETMSSFLAAAEDALAGEALYDHYAPEALLVMGRTLLPAREVDRAAFGRAHREVADEYTRLDPPRRRKPQLADLSMVAFEPDGDRAVAWFSGREVEDDRLVAVATGFIRRGDAWRIGWTTLAEQPEAWDYEAGAMQAASEFAFALAEWLQVPRTMLDAAYFRLFRHDQVAILTLPDARFSCHGSGTCCTFDYQIVLPAAAQAFIDAVPWERVDSALAGQTTLPVREDGLLQLKEKGERCRFLDEQSHCTIHKLMGRQPFPSCAVYPYSFAATPDGVAVSTSYVCGSVRQNIGMPLASNHKELYFRMAQMGWLRTDQYRLTPELGVPWDLFKDAEAGLIALLDRSDLPLHRRLWLGSRLLEAWPDPRVPLAWEQEAIEPLSAEEREAVEGLLAKLVGWDRARLAGLPAPTAAPDHRLAPDPWTFANLLKNLHFSKAYSYKYDMATAQNLAILLYVLALQLQSRYPDQPLPEPLWEELGALGTHNLLFSVLGDDPQDPMRQFMSRPENGRWLLRYPVPAR